MDTKSDLSLIKQIPIIDVAKCLGIPVRGTMAMCFMGHDKASPSLSFMRSRNTWRCFGACGKHGDGIALVMEKEGLDFKSALEWFARNFAVDVNHQIPGLQRPRRATTAKNVSIAPKVAHQQVQEFAADPELYHWFIRNCGGVSSRAGFGYLETHAISEEAATRFNVREMRDASGAFRVLVKKFGKHRVYLSGIAWGTAGQPQRLAWGSHALLFPFYEQGVVKYIQARMFEGRQKFLNLRGVAKPLFNADRLHGLPAGKSVHLCEGVPDAIALEAKGLVAVGVLGATSFRPEWVDRFLKFNVVLLGDGDEAGEKFTKEISKLFMDRGKAVQSMSLPKGKDVAEVLVGTRRTK